MKNLLLCLFSLQLYADIVLPGNTLQLLIVSSPDFNSTKASLQTYEKKDGVWREVFEPISVNLGRSGLAWGKGLRLFRSKNKEPVKKEGDGKSPAGLFGLESFFGYEARSFNFPYLQVTSSSICVDDSSSVQYNQIIQTQDPKQYKSFEYLKRDDNLYKLGIVVGHNKEGMKKGGSCIFIHIQRGPNSSTSGCTSLQEEKLLKIMKWLKKSKNPLLLQAPQNYLEQGFN